MLNKYRRNEINLHELLEHAKECARTVGWRHAAAYKVLRSYMTRNANNAEALTRLFESVASLVKIHRDWFLLPLPETSENGDAFIEADHEFSRRSLAALDRLCEVLNTRRYGAAGLGIGEIVLQFYLAKLRNEENA